MPSVLLGYSTLHFKLGLALFWVFMQSACFPAPLPPIWTLPNLLPQERIIVSNTLALQKTWQFKIDDLFLGPMLSQNNTVYIPQRYALYALNAETGEKEWVFPSRGEISATDPQIAVSSSAIAFLTLTGSYEEITVLDAATGKPKWKRPRYVVYSFAIGDGRLYVGWMGHVSAYDLGSGSLVWEMSQGLPSSHRTISVYYENGTLRVHNGEERLYTLNINDGSILSSIEQPIFRFDMLSNGIIYDASWPSVKAINAQTGVILWKNPTRPEDGYIPPTLISKVLYVNTADGKLLAIEALGGAEKWKAAKVNNPFSNVVVFNDAGYVITSDGVLHGFALDTGAEIGTLATTPQRIRAWWTGRPAIPSLAVAGESLVVTFGDSFVYGFTAKSR